MLRIHYCTSLMIKKTGSESLLRGRYDKTQESEDGARWIDGNGLDKCDDPEDSFDSEFTIEKIKTRGRGGFLKGAPGVITYLTEILVTRFAAANKLRNLEVTMGQGEGYLLREIRSSLVERFPELNFQNIWTTTIRR